MPEIRALGLGFLLGWMLMAFIAGRLYPANSEQAWRIYQMDKIDEAARAAKARFK